MQLRETVSSYTAERLRLILERNGQKKSGNKPELVSRVVDGMIYGALPSCPACKKGHLYYAGMLCFVFASHSCKYRRVPAVFSM
jgi:hypothetical protein